MFLILLSILFIGLKLANFIDWHWFAVLIPTMTYIAALIIED